ncbi:MAG: GHKL domain-containing protein [Candidatus Limiplasma sp.]|nr:GHKL domain-containing protein [Candidatus Limiplasma sp.]
MKDNLIRAFGIFLNDFPYFTLALAGVLDYLRVSKGRALLRMVAMTLAHATSILLWMQFYPNYRSIQIPHELFFLALYLLFFFLTVRVEVFKLLFMGLFIKLFADVLLSLVAFIEGTFSPNDEASFGLTFNLIHLALLVLAFAPMYLFVTRSLRTLMLNQSRLWRFLWLLPLTLFALSMTYSQLNKEVFVTPRHLIFASLLLAFSVLVYTLIAKTFETIRERTLLEANMLCLEKMLEMQDTHYERLASGIEATRRARHDLRHQIAALRGYLGNGDIQGAKQYCDEIAHSIPTNYDQPLCDNFPVSAVAQHYAGLAQSEGISLSLRLDIPSDAGQVQDGELCVVIGNLMENAIEACKRQGAGPRFITLRALVQGDYLTITMDNSFDGALLRQGKEYLSRKREGAGIGLASLERVAEKNGGQAYFEPQGDVFHSSVILRMRHSLSTSA